MTNQEYTDKLKVLGLTSEWVASVAGVSVEIAESWKITGYEVPPTMVEMLEVVTNWVKESAQATLDHARQGAAIYGFKDGGWPIYKMLVFNNDEDYLEFNDDPDADAILATTHLAAMSVAKLALEEEGIANELVYMDKPAYITWLEGRRHSREALAEWTIGLPS